MARISFPFSALHSGTDRPSRVILALRPAEEGRMDDERSPIAGLVAAAGAGDQEAWRELVARYSPLLVSVLRRFGLSRTETEDVAQTVWLRMVEHLGALREPHALPKWLVTTGRREAMRHLTSGRRDWPQDPQQEEWVASAGEDDDPDEALDRAERHQALLAGMAELPSRQRELLVMLMVDPPLSYLAISRRSGIPVGSIGPTRARAIERLRQTAPMQAYQAGLDELSRSGGRRP
jgi:RNA polymerase sigma factor (sigma-70 family)